MPETDAPILDCSGYFKGARLWLRAVVVVKVVVQAKAEEKAGGVGHPVIQDQVGIGHQRRAIHLVVVVVTRHPRVVSRR